ncbi:MAG TPA: hypothetical protein VKX17_07740 [Planctomycetota bacterium]|nr:hypothetical protein [Planctomycetota bacterium]
MSRVVRIAFFVGIIVFVSSPIIHAASPNITGTWAGSATGTEYRDQTDSTGGTTPVKDKASGNATASITQTGTDLSFSLTVVSTNHSGSSQTFVVPFTGKVGDFAFWATGVRPALGESDPAAQCFISGHFDAKPSKITGNFILYSSSQVVNVGYSLKKTSSTPTARDTALALAFPTGSPRDDTTPFNIAGSSTGKAFDFSTSAKALSVKSTITGTIDPVAKTATITVVNGANSQTFNVSEVNGGKAFVNSGSGGSETLIFFGVGSGSGNGTGAAGIGWRYSDTGMTEFKYSVKRQ